MNVQTVFERIEKKYLITPTQFELLWPILLREMQPDQYGRHTICNIYYDTPDYRLIRASLEKPVYKEKLRLRSYGVPTRDSTVFLELKKKYKGIVYKRREQMPLAQATDFLENGAPPGGADSQILREITAFLAFWQPEPKVFLAYDRVALFGRTDPELRLTIDTNIRWRTGELDLTAGDEGEDLSIQGQYLMEVKIPDAMPLWMARAFSLLDIYPVSLSKYGLCYTECLLPQLTRKPQLIKIGGMPCA